MLLSAIVAKASSCGSATVPMGGKTWTYVKVLLRLLDLLKLFKDILSLQQNAFLYTHLVLLLLVHISLLRLHFGSIFLHYAQKEYDHAKKWIHIKLVLHKYVSRVSAVFFITKK